MDTDLFVSLRASPQDSAAQKPLAILISQINEQRGSFRNITEESLLEEIKASEAGKETETIEDDESEDEAKTQREAVITAREEVLKQISRAHNDALYALDFISLLLSKLAPRQGELSMSPLLKQLIPSGSLGSEIIQRPEKSAEQKKDDELVSRGWKLEGLNSAVDSILRSATQLKKEVELETKYWEQMLAIKGEGWSICRMPKQRHTLGVRFGFSEAAPEFRDRGLAPLRRAADGSLYLDQNPIFSQRRMVRIRIQKDGQIIGSTCLPEKPVGPDEPVEKVILQARNSLYEEELFYEINREARTLTNQGVRNFGNAIHFPFIDQQEVLVDLVKCGDPELEIYPQKDVAVCIAVALRLLLSHAHQLNLRQRSQPPPPLTDRKRPLPVYSLLRPILTHIQHYTAQRKLYDLLNGFACPFRSAGLESYSMTFSSSAILEALTNLTPEGINTQSSIANALLTAVSAPLNSSITLKLPSGSSVSINIFTRLQMPTFGTEYTLSPITRTSSSYLPTSQLRFSDINQLSAYILYLLTLDVTHTLVSQPYLSQTETEHPIWTTHNLMAGEITVTFPDTAQNKRVMISVTEGRFDVSWKWRHTKSYELSVSMHAWVNDQGANTRNGNKTLEDIVKAIERTE